MESLSAGRVGRRDRRSVGPVAGVGCYGRAALGRSFPRAHTPEKGPAPVMGPAATSSTDTAGASAARCSRRPLLF